MKAKIFNERCINKTKKKNRIQFASNFIFDIIENTQLPNSKLLPAII